MKTYRVYYEPTLSLEVVVRDDEGVHEAICAARKVPREQWECTPDDYREYRGEVVPGSVN